MHADEIVTTPAQVARMVAEQLPQWAHLGVRPVAEHGTDHCLFRLGEELVVRMPRIGWAADQAASDARWLPVLAPYLPVDVPVPVASGRPDGDFPWAWSVVPWLPGRNPTPYEEGPRHLGGELAAFVAALRAVDTAGGPVATDGRRGAPLRHWDEAVRSAIEAAGARLPHPEATLEAWEHCATAPDWSGPPVWLHGDLMAGNLLVEDGRLSGVIDFGALGVGDPAADLSPCWHLLGGTARRDFRAALDHDEDTWRRGRGWAMGPALTGIPYYWDTVPAFAERGLRTVAVVLDDLGLVTG
jgi:aminoglycoside phosphotransferase (APT) family kinase protein